MNNYLLAIEAMQQMADAGAAPVDGFDRAHYEQTFQQAYELYLPAFDAIEELYNSVAEPGVMISNMAQAYTDRSAEKLQNLSKRQAEQEMLNRNMYLAVIVFPAILHYKGNSSQELCDAIQRTWKEQFPKSNVQPAELEFIQKGFHHKWCYVTTAVCTTLGKGDHCYELETLRSYRDLYLANTEDGYEKIQNYYDVAPSIVKHINERSDSRMIYRNLYDEYIEPCIHMIERGENEKCERLYQEMLVNLKQQYFYVQ